MSANNNGPINNFRDVIKLEENFSKTKTIEKNVKLNRACVYCCFCFVRKRKILSNIILDEGMNIIKNMYLIVIFECLGNVTAE